MRLPGPISGHTVAHSIPRVAAAARILATFVCLAAARDIAGQPAAGTIAGTVTNDQGNPLADVTVAVQNQLTGSRHSATTDLVGRYEIADLASEGATRATRVAVPPVPTVNDECRARGRDARSDPEEANRSYR